MSRFLTSLARFFSAAAPQGQAVPDVARKLMERAGANLGRDPHQAQELRRAAFAYLSVVR
jgi:hypothetical protein